MGIIAWIVLGLAAGLLANMLIPGKRSQGLILTCLIGIAGALGGGWAATKLFHIHSLQGFFNLSTWLTAIAGSAVLLLAYHLVTGAVRAVPAVRLVRAPLTTPRPARAAAHRRPDPASQARPQLPGLLTSRPLPARSTRTRAAAHPAAPGGSRLPSRQPPPPQNPARPSRLRRARCARPSR